MYRNRIRKSQLFGILFGIAVAIGISLSDKRIRHSSQKEKRFSSARADYERSSVIYRLTGRLFDFHDRFLGPSNWSARLARDIESANAEAWEELRTATYFASIEIVAVFSERQDADVAYAKLYLNNFGRNFTIKPTNLQPDGTWSNWELRVPNKFASRAASVLKETQPVTVATLTDMDGTVSTKVTTTFRRLGLPVLTMPNVVNTGESHLRDVVVLEDDRDEALRILHSILF